MSRWNVNTGRTWHPVWYDEIEDFVMFSCQNVDRIRRMAVGDRYTDGAEWVWIRVS